MERITSDARFRAICQAGRGVVYNDFSGHGPSGGQYNIVHAAPCTWLGRSNVGVAKLWFEDLATATDWLVRERGPEGQGWKRCGTCNGAAPSPVTSWPRPPASPATTGPDLPDAPSEYLVMSEPGGSRVEAWSSARLPFEPTGQMRELRRELRRAVAQLSAGPAEALHAIYTSPVDGHFDVENVLVYNVGPSAFARVASLELMVEGSIRPVFDPPPGLSEARHHYSYEVGPSEAPWRRWSAARLLASFGPLDLGPLADVLRPSRVWYALRRAGAHLSSRAGIPSRFGLDLVLEAPADGRVNLAVIAKPLLDGVVAAFHAHDDTATLDVVGGRIAAQLDASVDEICGLLSADQAAILGTRRLVWPWRDGVQWNPADDLCLAFRVRRLTRSEKQGNSGTLRLRGCLVDIQPR
jgi:hypothetical protein